MSHVENKICNYVLTDEESGLRLNQLVMKLWTVNHLKLSRVSGVVELLIIVALVPEKMAWKERPSTRYLELYPKRRQPYPTFF